MKPQDQRENPIRVSFYQKSKSSSRLSSERGAAIPLLIVLITVILIFAGLALDTTILSVTKTEQRQLAENVALSSLSTYLNSSGQLNARLDLVKQRAQEVLRGNITLARPFMISPSAADDIDALGAGRSGGQNGVLIPGRWHFMPPQDCSIYPNSKTCPCSAINSWQNPCFEEVDLDLDPDSPINAFKANLALSGTTSIKTLFMSVAGVESSNMFTTAVAATYPRHGVFLLDLARSSHAESHQAYESSGGDATIMRLSAEYAFSVQGSCADFKACAGTTPAVGATCDIRGGVTPQLYRNLWYSPVAYNFIPDLTPSPRPAILRKHYKGDYECFDLTWNDPGIRNAPPFAESYLVDTYRDVNYSGPEPLDSMLAGVNLGLRRVAGNTVAGDLIGFVGFDYSARVSSRRFDLDDPASNQFKELQNITDTTFPSLPCLTDNAVTSRTCRIRDHLLISRRDSGKNLPEALRVARQMLRDAASNDGAEQFVVVFSDGMTNCSGNRTCGNDQRDVLDSLTETESIIQNSYLPEQIKLHFIQIGDSVGPHTLLAPSPFRLQADGTAAGCLTDDEVRKYSAPTLSGGALRNYDLAGNNYSGSALNTGGIADYSSNMRTQGAKYFEPNRLYSTVAKTGGIWAPIRRPCQSGTDVTPQLENACRGQTFTETNSKPDTLTLAPFTDSAGRILCEPNGTSKRMQIQDAMDRIFLRAPYLVVQ